MVFIIQVPISSVQNWRKVLVAPVAFATIFGHLKSQEILSTDMRVLALV
jgi:hypothetical protein